MNTSVKPATPTDTVKEPSARFGSGGMAAY
jgi:hypothetical protein